MKQYRQFVDARGVVWRVYRVEPQSLSPSLVRLRETMTHVETERREPWLLFESTAGDQRRLTPVPAQWEQNCTDAEVADWCAAADAIPPAPMRRESDRRTPGDQNPVM
jgi:hypothetical protein